MSELPNHGIVGSEIVGEGKFTFQDVKGVEELESFFPHIRYTGRVASDGDKHVLGYYHKPKFDFLKLMVESIEAKKTGNGNSWSDFDDIQERIKVVYN